MALLYMSKRIIKSLRVVVAVTAAGLLSLPSVVKAADETYNNVLANSIPNLTSFDISWFDPLGGGTYLLADRSHASIDTLSGPFAQFNFIMAGFVGVATNPSGGTNNDLSGPNGVLTFNNTVSGQDEIWVGDGPQAQPGCASFLTTCSAVKVLNANTGALMHTIVTNGAARADELCSDPVDHMVLIANDAEYDFSFGTPFISFISTDTYQVVKGVQIPEATNGIEQCKWDSTTGYFFINIPEINGPGNDTVDGGTYVYDHTGKLVAQYIIDIGNTHCAGPQGMAVGPEPQLLLGCNAPDKNGQRNSVIINKHTGQTLAIAWGLGGADEVWFDPSVSHYLVTGSSQTPPQWAVFDGTGAGAVDQIITLPKFGAVSPHSIAGLAGFVVVPNAGEVNVYFPPTFDSDDPNSPFLSN